MYYELYIDLFFLENFMIDSLLLLAVDRMMRYGRPKGRLILGGALGSLLTCLVIVIPMPSCMKVPVSYFAGCTAMIVTGFGKTGTAQKVRIFCLLNLSAVIMGGAVLLFRPYMRFAAVFHASAAAGYYAITGFWKLAAYIRRNRAEIFRVTLCKKDRKITVNALWDTGNRLRDFITDAPVSIIDPAVADKICEAPEKEPGFHMIPCRSIGGDAVIRVFRIEKLCLHGKEEKWVASPMIGVSEVTLSRQSEYDMILNPDIFS